MKTYSDCMEAREDFSAYLDGEMGPESRGPLEAHLAICADCLRELDALKRVDDSYRKLDRVSAPADFEAGVREAVRSGHMPAAANRRNIPRWMGPLVAMASAAAVLVVGVLVLELRQPKVGELQVASAPAEVKESISQLTSAARAPMPAQTNATAAGALQDKSAPGDGSAWKSFAKAPTSAAPTAPAAGGGREDSGDTLKQGLDEARGKADQSASNAATSAEKASTDADARADVIGTPPAVPQAAPMREKVVDAPKYETETLPQAAPSSPAPSAPGEVMNRQTLRSFNVRADGWYERGYNNQPRTPLKRESPELRELMKKHSGEDWMKLLAKKSKIVFEVGGTWYELEPDPAESK